MQWQSTITIDRPIMDVFAFATDAGIGSKWHRANRISPVSPGPIGLGSTFRVEGRFLFWTFDSLSEVTAFEAGRLVEYSSDAGMYAYTLRYELEPAGGGTLFREIGTANPKGLLKFAIRLFAGGAKKNSERGLRLLKTELETQA